MDDDFAAILGLDQLPGSCHGLSLGLVCSLRGPRTGLAECPPQAISGTTERRVRVWLATFRNCRLLMVHRTIYQTSTTANSHQPALLHRRGDEARKQRVRLERARFRARGGTGRR